MPNFYEYITVYGFVNARTAQLGMLGQILSIESALIRSEDTLILVFRQRTGLT